jgi:beta-galactosidase
VTLRRHKDYCAFYLQQIDSYVSTLARWMRSAGVDVPLMLNAGGPDMNALFLEEQRSSQGRFLIGTDHYYNLGPDFPQNEPTYQRLVDAFCSLETLRLMGYPPTVIELQGGSPYDWPPITANDARAWYWAHLAYGMKGCNFYIFAGGDNPQGAGTTSNSYDYQAAIASDGKVRKLYSIQKRLGNFLQGNAWLMAAHRVSDCRVGLNFDYCRSVHGWPQRATMQVSDAEAWRLLKAGMLTSAFCASLSPNLCDLGKKDWIADTVTPVLVATGSSMSTVIQRNLVEFLSKGGRVLLAPVLPTLDENLQPCTILAEYLGSPVLQEETQDSVLLTIDGIDGVGSVHSERAVFYTAQLPSEAEIIGTGSGTKQIVAWRKTISGGGALIFLGLRWEHAQRQHSTMLYRLLKRLQLEQHVMLSNENVLSSLRTDGTYGCLFLINPFAFSQQTSVTLAGRPLRDI